MVEKCGIICVRLFSGGGHLATPRKHAIKPHISGASSNAECVPTGARAEYNARASTMD